MNKKKITNCEKCGAETRPVQKEEFDTMLKACLTTPPLRLKDLKERLKKEREEKKLAKQHSENQF